MFFLFCLKAAGESELLSDPKYQQYMSDPAVQKALQDPRVQEELTDPQVQGALSDPTVRKQLATPAVRESLEKAYLESGELPSPSDFQHPAIQDSMKPTVEEPSSGEDSNYDYIFRLSP
jgi:hypothetical protein